MLSAMLVTVAAAQARARRQALCFSRLFSHKLNISVVALTTAGMNVQQHCSLLPAPC